MNLSRRLCSKYRFFFYVAICIVCLQLYMGYSFYSLSREEMEKLERWKSSLDKSENSQRRQDGQVPREDVLPHSKRRRHINNDMSANHIPNELPSHKDNQLGSKLQFEHQTIKPTRNSTYRIPCKIESKEALSALLRAKTEQCKQEIADLTCQIQNNAYYPKFLPRYCPLKGGNEGEYIGCYKDDRLRRELTGHHTEFKTDNSPNKCIYHCLRAGHKYAGMQFGYECWCGDRYGHYGKLPEERCDSMCPGDHSKQCGGYLALNIYHTGLGKKPYSNAELVYEMSEKVPPVRIAFVLTVNGRAVRQVKRLFKALYHEQHYYYIHVDSRQEYLHRELSKLAEKFPNVRLTSWRMSTIWGGASLLTMLMRCMADLTELDWKWDFFINLSESDFPVKHNDALVRFLSHHKDKNFVKSHGKDTPRFIRKQGLDRTFYECDTHMWRLGTRKLPDGIRIDGGSDWVALNRKFCQYIVTTEDELISGLRKVWKHTLLPAESFFHTTLQNSEFCTSMVNNNLHLTNWRRKQGCKCQYKHIVDWCGCSPNDFKPVDLLRIKNLENRPIFFARKFEAVVNQEVISDIELLIFGSYPNVYPALTSYWQNEYHYEDYNTHIGDEYLTLYHTFARLGTGVVRKQVPSHQGCHFTPAIIKETNVFLQRDSNQGLLVLYTAVNKADGRLYTLETHVQPERYYRVLKAAGPVARIISLEVGSLFDPKEEIFRNYGGLFGPSTNLTLKHEWGSGQHFTVTVVWVDPTKTVVASYDIPISPDAQMGIHVPTLRKPLRPGFWTVKLMYLWEVAAEVEFLVTPLTHHNGREITGAESAMLHGGPRGYHGERMVRDLQDLLKMSNREEAIKLANQNVHRTGESLKAWADELTSSMWRIQRTCVSELSGTSLCPRLPRCQQATWSSLSPDPKSQIGEVNRETGMLR